MSRDWKISMLAAGVCHIGLLYGFQTALRNPPRLTRNPAVEITLVAAPPEAAPVAVAPPPVEVPQPITQPSPPTKPVVVKPPEPEPVAKPAEPVVIKPSDSIVQPPPPVRPQPAAAPEPVVTPTPPEPIAMAAAATRPAPVVGDGSSLKPGPDPTTQQAQPGIRAKPDYLKNPEPPYPALARRRHQEGLVLLSVKVSAQGRAARVELKQSSGFSALDEAAIQAVRGWEFEPARVGATPVDCEIEVPVRFRLQP